MAGKKDKWYAVFKGHTPGIYKTWPDCQEQIRGFKKPKYRSFTNLKHAHDFHRLGYVRPPLENLHKFFDNIIYTDGAYSSKTNTAGIGVYFGKDDPRNISAPLAQFWPNGELSNQRAEAAALLEALKLVNDQDRTLVYTDSEYCKNALTWWIPYIWMKNGWKTKEDQPVLNQDILRPCYEEVKRKGKRLQIEWVKGHSAIIGNENADKLAVAGACLKGNNLSV